MRNLARIGLSAAVAWLFGVSFASAQTSPPVPIKVSVTAKPPADADAKKQKDVADTASDIIGSFKLSASKQAAVVESGDEAEVAFEIVGRKQAAIGPKQILYNMRVGRGTALDLNMPRLGGLWIDAAKNFVDAMAQWFDNQHDRIKSVATRRASAGEVTDGYVDIIDARFGPAVGYPVAQLKTMGSKGLAIGVPPLLAWFDDEKYRAAAGEFLKDLTGQKFGKDKAKWEQWWAGTAK